VGDHADTELAGTTGAPSGTLSRDGLEQARRYGGVHEYQGLVALTGAGAYHAGEISGGLTGRQVWSFDSSPTPARPSW
jgi:hypothetical protein